MDRQLSALFQLPWVLRLIRLDHDLEVDAVKREAVW